MVPDCFRFFSCVVRDVSKTWLVEGAAVGAADLAAPPVLLLCCACCINSCELVLGAVGLASKVMTRQVGFLKGGLALAAAAGSAFTLRAVAAAADE